VRYYLERRLSGEDAQLANGINDLNTRFQARTVKSKEAATTRWLPLLGRATNVASAFGKKKKDGATS